jgi:hypothetical protein
MASTHPRSRLARTGALGLATLLVAGLALPALGGCYPAKDCQRACRHVLDCVGRYDDADLLLVTQEDCVASCEADEQLNVCFDDCDAAEVRVKWQCATGNADCSSLDHTCDVF